MTAGRFRNVAETQAARRLSLNGRSACLRSANLQMDAYQRAG